MRIELICFASLSSKSDILFLIVKMFVFFVRTLQLGVSSDMKSSLVRLAMMAIVEMIKIRQIRNLIVRQEHISSKQETLELFLLRLAEAKGPLNY